MSWVEVLVEKALFVFSFNAFTHRVVVMLGPCRYLRTVVHLPLLGTLQFGIDPAQKLRGLLHIPWAKIVERPIHFNLILINGFKHRRLRHICKLEDIRIFLTLRLLLDRRSRELAIHFISGLQVVVGPG